MLTDEQVTKVFTAICWDAAEGGRPAGARHHGSHT